MERPAVLILEPDAGRRREVATGLSEFGYEVVPAVGVEEGLRFAAGLGPAVVVAGADLPGVRGGELGERLLESLSGEDGLRTLLLLGEPGEEETLPDEVLFLPAAETADLVLVRKIRLVLLGREIGVEPDARIESLVGDFSLEPPLELVRGLYRARFSGRVVADGGELVFRQGSVVDASAGRARGVKAFCRLGRRSDGVFRVWPELVPESVGEIDEGVPALVIRAVEDAAAGTLPPTRARLSVELGPAFFSSSFSERQKEILTLAHEGRRRAAGEAPGATVGEVLDAFPEVTDGELAADLEALVAAEVLRIEWVGAGVQVVTDSTADLPSDVVDRLGIEVVPLTVLFGERELLDGVELAPREFYELLERKEHHPSTRPPSLERFSETYRRLLAERDLVSLHISSELSDTFAHASEAAAVSRRGTPPRDGTGEAAALPVVDSRQVSLSLGLLVVFAARMAHRGLPAREIAERIEAMRERVEVLFVVDTLDYLARGGRIGKARALVGKLLGIKPILGVVDGQVVPVDRVRGGRAAHPRILELLSGRLDPDRPILAGIAHAKAPVWADRLGRLLEESFDVTELLVTEMGAVVGTHSGPGTVGTAVFQPTGEELELVRPLEG